MKEKPILFSGPMVRAILAGNKTQTRRVVKPQPEGMDSCYEGDFRQDAGGRVYPYGEPGDRLWVKETFCPRYFDDGKPGYRADWNAEAGEYAPEPKWKSSLFMPRALSRITLEVTGVRVERVQEIGEGDARAEGAEPATAGVDGHGPIKTHRTGFVRLWDSINAKRAPWASNPWVWVIEFRRVS